MLCFDCIGDSELGFVSQWIDRRSEGGGERTGNQEELLKDLVAMSSPVVMAFTEPVTAMALTFLPYLLALFKSSTPLSSCQTQAHFTLPRPTTYPLTLGLKKSLSKSVLIGSSNSGAAV